MTECCQLSIIGVTLWKLGRSLVPAFPVMRKILLVLLVTQVFTAAGAAAEPPQAAAWHTPQRADMPGGPQDLSSPENALLAEQPQTEAESLDKRADGPVSAHKVNYFAIDNWPGKTASQVKFQLSMKFRMQKPDVNVHGYDLFPIYFAYTQKSLWDVGRPSMPFEETNYNPEFFLEYPINTALLGRLKLREVVVSPLEHESNGLAGPQSRSWNRQYILVRLGFKSVGKLTTTNSFLPDKAGLYVKLWRATGISDENAYLRSTGNSAGFLNYMGRGELGVSVRNFLWGGSLSDHQLDIRTPIFQGRRKDSYEFEFRQQFPGLNFALYLQYWYGYGETLLRFDQFGRRGFAGLSFSY